MSISRINNCKPTSGLTQILKIEEEIWYSKMFFVTLYLLTSDVPTRLAIRSPSIIFP